MVDRNLIEIKNKIKEGVSIRAIAKEIGVHHSTVLYWIKNDRISKITDTDLITNQIHKICKENSGDYAYILGSYLGDGYINQTPRTYRLRIYNSLDNEIISDQIKSLSLLFPNNKVSEFRQKHAKCVEVGVHNKQLPIYFPQHGSGHKHEREIKLSDWQTLIVREYPECFLKGLLDSDGSMYLHKVGHISYRYYMFTNKSSDILTLYTTVMDLLGISYTMAKKNCGSTNIYTRRFSEVEKIDSAYEIAESILRSSHQI